MSIVCKKCGCDAMIKDGDWYKCPSCGAEIFDTSVTVNSKISPTKAIEKIESNPVNQVEENHEDNKPKKEKKSKNKNDDGDKTKPSKLKETIDFFLPIVIAVVVALLLKCFVFANAIVPTGSMLNTIQKKDRIIASRLAYINNDPQRYDIVLFYNPDNENEIFVKRLIGLPGETVQVIKGVVYVTKADGETIQLDDSFVTACEPDGDFGPFEVPEDCYFMMGDNRNNSWDSRFWDNKFVHRDKILGKAMFRYYPNPSKLE